MAPGSRTLSNNKRLYMGRESADGRMDGVIGGRVNTGSREGSRCCVKERSSAAHINHTLTQNRSVA